MSVTRITKFEAKEGMADDLHQFLDSIVVRVEQAPGCTSCKVLQSQENLKEFLCIEVWDSVSAHQATVKNIPAEKIGEAMTLLARQPSGSYYTA